jgi:type I restriction enzyme M protein
VSNHTDLQANYELHGVFNELRNYLAGMASDMTRDESLLQQLIPLLFCKIYTENNAGLKEKFQAESNVSSEVIKKRISTIFEMVKKEFEDIFDEKELIELEAESIKFIVSKLQNYELTAIDQDTIGNLFESLLGRSLKGSKGQFFTPRNVVKLAVDITDPNVGEYVLDPACGSGGFLTIALGHVWDKLDQKAKHIGWTDETLTRKKKDASDYFMGIDKDSFLVKIAKTSMALLGDGRTNIFCENSLKNPSEWTEVCRSIIKFRNSDVILTNPPFGAKIQIKGEQILSQYELAYKWILKDSEWIKSNILVESRPPQILFIERCIQLLREDGKLAIVLPDGILSNPKDRYITDYIMKNAEILALIDLPLDTFLPYTPTKTHLLVLQKKKNPKQEKIFMAIAYSCGHDKRGKPVYKIDKNGNKQLDDDLLVIGKRYHDLRHKDDEKYDHLGFFIDVQRLKKGILMPKYYNPEITNELKRLEETDRYDLVSIGELEEQNKLQISRGHEIGSIHYGTGDIPFIRTSEISNWEIAADPTHCVSEDVYEQYRTKQDLLKDDILIVNDGTYLVGRTAILSEFDTKIVIQSHFRKIRVVDRSYLTPYLLLYLLGLEIVQDQIESKTFRQATISTLGNRLRDVILPIPIGEAIKTEISESVKSIVEKRAQLRYIAMHMQFGNKKENVMGLRNKAGRGNV